MKTMKILTTALLLLLTASINLVSAQNDSIYNLEISKENGTISFYSTYDMNNAKTIYVSSYFDLSNGELSALNFYRNESDLDSISFTPPNPIVPIKWFCEKIGENVYKISYSGFFVDYLIPNDNPQNLTIRVNLYIDGDGFVPPSNNFRSGTIGQSNTLTYYFNPLNTSLKETTDSGNFTYKYYLLSGIESKTKPEGKPFIQATFKNEKLISTDKVIQVRK